METAVEYDPFLAGTGADPYAVYAQLREHHPLYHSKRHGFYALSRFEDVNAVSADWHRFSNAEGIDLDQTGEYFGPNFVSSDPPGHLVMRRLIQDRFTGKAVETQFGDVIRGRVRAIVGGLTDEKTFDIGMGLAWSLPVYVTCHLLGFPPGDAAFLGAASARFEEREPGRTSPPPTAVAAATELRAYVIEQIEFRRSHPGDDITSLLISAEVDGRPLPRDELVGNTLAMINAGSQTTACLMSSAFVLLGSDPEQRLWLCNHLNRIPNAIEEFLRFESPVQVFIRTVNQEVEIHQTKVAAGAKIALLYGAANRDPRVWNEPERLDLSREPQRHLAFGQGIHHCLGASLARLETRITLEELMGLLPRLTLVDQPTRLRSHVLRGYVNVRVSIESR